MAKKTTEMIVGENIRARREKLGMKIETLARTLNISTDVLREYERGRSRMSPDLLVETAQALGVRVGDLFFGDKKP